MELGSGLGLAILAELLLTCVIAAPPAARTITSSDLEDLKTNKVRKLVTIS